MTIHLPPARPAVMPPETLPRRLAADATNIADLRLSFTGAGPRASIRVEIVHVFGGPTDFTMSRRWCDELILRLRHMRRQLDER